jgi:hypothetical protein
MKMRFIPLVLSIVMSSAFAIAQSDSSSQITRSKPSKNLLLIKLLNGRSIEGEYLSSTDSSVTYRTRDGAIALKKSIILSVQEISNTPTIPTRTVLVKEYNDMPFLLFTIAGGIWAVTLFNDAGDYSDAADAFSSLRLNSLAEEARSKSSEKTWTGIGASVASLIFLIIAVTPTEHYIEQPVTIIPTSNGVKLAIRF